MRRSSSDSTAKPAALWIEAVRRARVLVRKLRDIRVTEKTPSVPRGMRRVGTKVEMKLRRVLVRRNAAAFARAAGSHSPDSLQPPRGGQQPTMTPFYREIQ